MKVMQYISPIGKLCAFRGRIAVRGYSSRLRRNQRNATLNTIKLWATPSFFFLFFYRVEGFENKPAAWCSVTKTNLDSVGLSVHPPTFSCGEWWKNIYTTWYTTASASICVCIRQGDPPIFARLTPFTASRYIDPSYFFSPILVGKLG